MEGLALRAATGYGAVPARLKLRGRTARDEEPMPETPGDNGIKVDIPQTAIDDAMKSVERNSGEGEAQVEGPLPPVSEELAELKAMLEDSAARAATTQARLKETHERYLRVAADFENWKKRAFKATTALGQKAERDAYDE